jgi:hypothetical protein
VNTNQLTFFGGIGALVVLGILLMFILLPQEEPPLPDEPIQPVGELIEEPQDETQPQDMARFRNDRLSLNDNMTITLVRFIPFSSTTNGGGNAGGGSGGGGGGSGGGGGGSGGGGGGSNHAPVAVNDTTTTLEDAVVIIIVLANDSDPDGNSLLISSFTQTRNGSVTDNHNGTLAYTPEENYNGQDSFTYKVSDSSLESNNATVTISITPVNDVPVADAGPDQTVNESICGESGKRESNIDEDCENDGEDCESEHDDYTLEGKHDDEECFEPTIVHLSGSGSDPDRDPLTFRWVQTKGPSVKLSDANSTTPSFIAPRVDKNITLEFQLAVSDGVVGNATDLVEIKVLNTDGEDDYECNGEGHDKDRHRHREIHRHKQMDEDKHKHGDIHKHKEMGGDHDKCKGGDPDDDRGKHNGKHKHKDNGHDQHKDDKGADDNDKPKHNDNSDDKDTEKDSSDNKNKHQDKDKGGNDKEHKDGGISNKDESDSRRGQDDKEHQDKQEEKQKEKHSGGSSNDDSDSDHKKNKGNDKEKRP